MFPVLPYALLVALALPACSAQRPPPLPATENFEAKPARPNPWPAEGRCVDFFQGCRVFMPADIDVIRTVVLDYLTPERIAERLELARARELASWPVNAPMIGGYEMFGSRSRRSEYRLEALSRADAGSKEVFEIQLAESSPGQWTVVSIARTIRPMPAPASKS